MIFTNNRIMILLALSLLLLISGCGSNNNNLNSANPDNQPDAGNNQPATEQPTSTNSGETNGGDAAGEDADADEAVVMDEFANLAKSNASSAELLVYITDNYKKVGPENVTGMLVALEKAQHEQSLELEDRYYTEEGVQEKLMDLYISDDFTLPEPGELKDETLRKLLQDAKAGGYKTETTEGAFFPVIDYERYRQFQPNVTDDMKVYIDIMALESNVAAIKDAGLTIEWEEVVKRALSMEQFLRDFPDSVKREDMQNLFDGYVYITFQGIDNSPLFAYDEEGKLLAEVRSAFEEAVRGGTGTSDYLSKIAEFLQVVDDHGGVQTEEVAAFQEKVTAGLLE